MSVEDIKYEYKTVQTLRGTETRTKAKWHKDGWEFVDQTQGRLRSAITLRRPKPKPPWRKIAAGGAVVALLIAFAGIMSALETKDNKPVANAPTVETSQTPVQDLQPAPLVIRTEAPVETPTSTEEPSLTIRNNADLAALLAGTADGPVVEKFAAKHQGQLIAFDGNISAMANHGDYKTRYNLLLTAGDYSETNAEGPNFQFRNINITSDLGLIGSNIPDSIGVGDNFHFVARVGKFDPQSTLFFLEPVTTEFRTLTQ